MPALAAASPGFTGHVTVAGASAAGANGLVPDAPVPAVTGSAIVDRDAAIRLGKALFWDMQTGSDGQVACATCHFHAGADDRTRNTVHPGDTTFAGAGVTGPGQIVSLVSFDASAVNDRVGSSGVLSRSFVGIDPDPARPPTSAPTRRRSRAPGPPTRCRP